MGAARNERQQQELPSFQAGDLCETVAPIILREAEPVHSKVLHGIDVGTTVQLLELGQDHRRARVAAGCQIGWITLFARNQEPLVAVCEPEEVFEPRLFAVGDQLETTCLTPVRAGPHRWSTLVAEAEPGRLLQITELTDTDDKRARISTEDDVEGWVTLATGTGKLLVNKISRDSPKGRNSSTRSSIILLECSRAGNLQELKHRVNGSKPRRRSTQAVDLNCSDIRGRTPLIFAARAGRLEVVRFLALRSDVDVNALDDMQKTALHHAAERRRCKDGRDESHAELVKLLVDAGAFIGARDLNGCTALMLAVATGDLQSTRFLLGVGANANIKDYEGHTPLDYAKAFTKDQELIALLQSYGAKDPDSCGASMPQECDSTVYRSASLKASQRASLHMVVGVQENPWSEKRGETQDEAIAMEEQTAGMSEEDAERERVLSRVRIIMPIATIPHELEVAIRAAIDAGVQSEQLHDAERRVQLLRARASAHEQLLVAIATRCPRALREAISRAEEFEVPCSEIAQAHEVLRVEVPLKKAREQLKDAQEEGTVRSLAAALEQGKKAGISSAELAPVEELLKSAESRDKVQALLDRAIEAKNVPALRFALQQASEAEFAREKMVVAEELLAVEAPRFHAREMLKEAAQNPTVNGLREAIAKAAVVRLYASEYSSAQIMLEQEEAKERKLNVIQQEIDLAKTMDSSSLEQVTHARNRLFTAIKSAKAVGARETDLAAGELCRRRLHNIVEDLKGNVRVYCRIRPLSEREIQRGESPIATAVDSMTLTVDDKDHQGAYTFDAVFMPGTQHEVFESCRDLVQSAVDGHNVTMFAYGQTGAGKTYTMYGSPGNEGTAPRTIQEIYRIIERDTGRFNYTVMASMMELYRNELVDLLNKASHQKLGIRMDKTGMVQIEHLTEEQCADARELMGLLERGNELRTVAATAMNSESSRSHLILMVRIVSVNLETHAQVRGKIVICDLAGSERLKKSEVSGEKQKEAIEINKSLTALGDVIAALSKGYKQVPYRNHKLTQIMQDALGGSSKTLMFVNCSPSSTNTDETTMSLKYATRAKRIVNELPRKSLRAQHMTSGRPSQSQRASNTGASRPSHV